MTYLNGTRNLRHHAFVIESGTEEGIEEALAWAEKELGMKGKDNPDIVILRYGFLSVEEARKITDIAASKPLVGANKVLVIAASRIYREAQNALLKLFEEPPPNTYLFLILPTIGGLLPTLLSRIQVLRYKAPNSKSQTNLKSKTNPAEEFINSNKEKRSEMIKKLAEGKDEEERRENRDVVLAILNGVEEAAYKKYGSTRPVIFELLRDVQILRGYLHDRSAPVRLILEHLSLTLPKGLI